MLSYKNINGFTVGLCEKQGGENYYHSQRNNKINPLGACNITSLNMLFDYFGLKIDDDDVMRMTMQPDVENFYKTKLRGIFGDVFLKKHKLNTLWQVLEYVGNTVFTKNNIPVRVEFYPLKSIPLIVNALIETSAPVIVGTTLTKSGHLVVCNGFKKDVKGNIVSLYLHDPYGNVNLWYVNNTEGVNGRFVEISVDKIYNKIKSDRGLIFRRLA